MENELLLTVFTPTYNRAHTLERLYESLLAQNRGGFEWLVVDDGSADDTKEKMRRFTGENRFPVRYVYKENGGKHTALNRGIALARGKYFLCLDSDDCLDSGALEALFACLKRAPDGVIAYKTNMENGERIGQPFPEGLESTTLFSLINDYGCGGDRTLVHRTEILKTITIPEPEGSSFFPETWLYDRFDENYQCVVLAESICRCEYQPGGYSDSFRMLMIRNALPMKWFYGARLDMHCTFSQKLTSAYRYVAYSLLAPGKTGRCGKGHGWLLLLGFPKGVAMAAVYGILKARAGKK